MHPSGTWKKETILEQLDGRFFLIILTRFGPVFAVRSCANEDCPGHSNIQIFVRI